MKYSFTLFILIILNISIAVRAQFQPTSPYIQNPDLAIGYTDSCAQFWLQTLDDQSGGFAWNEAKGNSGKSGYHSIETGYYTYQ